MKNKMDRVGWALVVIGALTIIVVLYNWWLEFLKYKPVIY